MGKNIQPKADRQNGSKVEATESSTSMLRQAMNSASPEATLDGDSLGSLFEDPEPIGANLPSSPGHLHVSHKVQSLL